MLKLQKRQQRSRHSNIKRLNTSLHGYGDAFVTEGFDGLADTFTFVSKYKNAFVGVALCFVAVFSMGRKTVERCAFFLEGLERLFEVGGFDDGHFEKCTN